MMSRTNDHFTELNEDVLASGFRWWNTPGPETSQHPQKSRLHRLTADKKENDTWNCKITSLKDTLIFNVYIKSTLSWAVTMSWWLPVKQTWALWMIMQSVLLHQLWMLTVSCWTCINQHRNPSPGLVICFANLNQKTLGPADHIMHK